MKKYSIHFHLIIILSLIFTIGLQNNLFAQKKHDKSSKKSTDNKQEVIATVGNEKITFSDLEKAFKKNLNRKDINLRDIPKDSIDDFLKLYINYRLKVQDALSRGFDKDSSVLADIAQNRKVLAESFYYDKKLIVPKVETLMKLREKEMQIAIIQFAFKTPSADTMAAYKRAMTCLELLKKGEPFDKLARDSSEDKSTAMNNGVVPSFVTAGMVQRTIEDIIYKLKPGEYYPELVKTKYGYFIIKLVKSEPRVSVKARHILLEYNKDNAFLSEKKADSILALLKKGADFDKLAKENSIDNESVSNGGMFSGGYYNRCTGFEETERHLLPEVEDALFNLKDGEISGKVKSKSGIHIIKRESTRTNDPEKEFNDCKLLYRKVYFEQDKKVFLDSLRKTLMFDFNKNNLKSFISVLDTNITNLDSNWTKKVTKELKSKPLYKFINKETTIGEFIDMMNKRSDLRGLPTNETGINRAVDRILSPAVFDEASKKLEVEYPEFASLLNEFRDGILLFKVEALEVWDKLKFDSTLARKYWDTTKTRYKTEPAYDLSEIYVLDDSTAKSIYQELKAGKSFEELAASNTQRNGYREKKGKWGKVSSKDNKLAKIALEKNAKEGTILEPQAYEKGFSIIKINSYEPIRQKTFEEAISDFAPAFQDLMQKKYTEEWLNKIRNKFKVNINKKALDNILKTK